jgi:FAD:protein FMN transferase
MATLLSNSNKGFQPDYKLRNGIVLFLFFCLETNAQSRFEFTHSQMGTIFKISLFTDDSLKAKKASEKAFKKLDELNLILSDYREDSEINQLCKNAYNQPVKVSNELWDMLIKSKTAFDLSNHKFDVTMGSMTQLWRRMKRQNQLPSQEQIEKARSKVGFGNIIFNPENQSIQLKKEGLRIDFGGIGKGYAEDEMMKVLKENGISSAMIEAGGNIMVSNAPLNQKGWKIEIKNIVFYLKNCGISTSGDLFQFVEINGTKYSHILNPDTGIGMTTPIQISTIAKDGTISDWTSTAFCLMNQKERKKIANRLKIRVL